MPPPSRKPAFSRIGRPERYGRTHLPDIHTLWMGESDDLVVLHV